MIIFRYLGREIISTMMAVALVLVMVFLCHQFIHFLQAAAVGKLSGTAVLRLMSLAVPHMLGMVLPLSLFLGILLAYGRLYADSEMTALNACGFGRPELTRATLFIAFWVALAIAVIMFLVAPSIANKRNRLLDGEGTVDTLQTILPDRFIAQSHGRRVIYVDKVSRNHKRLESVFVAEQPDISNTKKVSQINILTADEAYERVDESTGDRFVVAVDGYRYVGTPGEREFTLSKFGKYHLRLTNEQDFEQDVDARSTRKVWRGRHQPEYMAELQWRFAMPIAALLLAFAAVPLSQLKPRQGKYARLFPAILLYIVYMHLLFVSRDWLRNAVINPYLGLWWVHLTFAVGVFGLYYRPKLQRRRLRQRDAGDKD